mgnify:CR=1 FL=1
MWEDLLSKLKNYLIEKYNKLKTATAAVVRRREDDVMRDIAGEQGQRQMLPPGQTRKVFQLTIPRRADIDFVADVTVRHGLRHIGQTAGIEVGADELRLDLAQHALHVGGVVRDAPGCARCGSFWARA